MALGDNKLSIWVGLRAEQFQKGIKKVQSGFKTLNRTIGAFSTAFVGQQIFQLGKQFADAAGEMENVERSFSRSFAGISSSVETELGKLADSLNRNETQLKKGAVSFNAFFKSFGKDLVAILLAILSAAKLEADTFEKPINSGLSPILFLKSSVATLIGSLLILGAFCAGIFCIPLNFLLLCNLNNIDVNFLIIFILQNILGIYF